MIFSSKLKYYLTFALQNQANFSKVSSENVDLLKIKIGLEIHARILTRTKIFSKLNLKLSFIFIIKLSNKNL